MNYIGIDVGLSGALSIINDANNVEVDLLSVDKLKTGAYKRWYNVPNILNKLESLKPYIAVIEYQRPMSKQGVTSMFRLGRGFGLLEGLLASTSEQYYVVDPKVWQNYFIKKLLTKEEQIAFKPKTKDIEYIRTQFKDCEFKDYYYKYSNLKSASLTKLRSMYVYYKLLEDSNMPIVKDHNKIDAMLISLYCKENYKI